MLKFGSKPPESKMSTWQNIMSKFLYICHIQSVRAKKRREPTIQPMENESKEDDDDDGGGDDDDVEVEKIE